MSYSYIIDMISSYDMSKYIPYDIVLILKKSPRIFTEEEVIKIVISGENYDYLTDMDMLSFAKENPHFLIENEMKNNKSCMQGKIYFELFCQKLKNNSKYLNDFIEFTRESPYWSQILKSKGVLDTLFELPSWDEIQTKLSSDEIEILKENSSGDAFIKYIKKMKSNLFYDANTITDDEFKNYQTVRKELFKLDDIFNVEKNLSYVLKEFIIENSVNRNLSFNFLKDILKVEERIREEASLLLDKNLKDILDYSLLIAKMLEPINLSIINDKNIKEKDIENSFNYIEEYIKLNGMGVLKKIIDDKEKNLSLMKYVNNYKEKLSDFIYKVSAENEKNEILSNLIDSDDSIKKKNRL